MTRTIFAGLFATSLFLAGTSVCNAAEVFVIHHKVADYAKWRPEFDNHKSKQLGAGLTNPRVYHAIGDANDITIVFDMADAAKAKAFAASPDLKARMMTAGVVGAPTFEYLETAH